MADDKTTKMPEQPVTDSGPGKETPPAPPKEPEKVSVSSEPKKKTEPEVKNPHLADQFFLSNLTGNFCLADFYCFYFYTCLFLCRKTNVFLS